MEHSIITECLCKSFGEKQVLNSISLKVKKGEIFGLLGPSGAGKTTFLNILTGQIQADSGKGLIFGQNIREFTAQMYTRIGIDRKSTRLNSSHTRPSRMPSSA